MHKIELLAPAKDKETAFAAIDCGADAVYIGAPAFGARHNATNSLENIQEVVNYAHKFYARVHVTLNTILTDTELDEAVELAYKLKDIGVDALIIQDMGLLNRLKDLPLPLHMSTQCDNYLPQKVKFFNELGVSRVILARELSVEQIKQIHEENPNLELESFIHGALCVSMSGQCYMSQYIGGRSANRGECAQPCRKQYDVITKDGEPVAKDIYPLCLKDFNGSKWINELIDAGVCSFKIEGRLKDINYVKNIVSYYRQLIPNKSSSGKSVYPFTPNPEKTFNRGFTDYFLNGRTDCFSLESPKSRGKYIGEIVSAGKNSFSIKTKEELHNGDGLYFNGDGCLVNKVEYKNGVYQITPNHPVKIKKGDKVYRNLDVEFEKELSKPVKRQIGLGVNIITYTPPNLPYQGEANNPSLGREGKGGFLPTHDNLFITLKDEDGTELTVTIPQGEKANNPEKMKENFIKQFSKTGESDFYIQNIEISDELPYLPISEINKLRRDLFEELMQKRIEEYNKNKSVQNPLKYVEYFTPEVDYRANVHNKSAKAFYEKCGVKVLEPSFESAQPKRKVELMRCKYCVKYALNMCKSPKELALRDSHGKIYPLKFNCQKCEMSVMSP